MAGKQENLKAYKVATDVMVQLVHAITTTELIPDAVSSILMSSGVGVMTDLEIGVNTKYRRKKSNYFARAAYKVSRLNSMTWIMKETGMLDNDDFKMVNQEIENLRKMIWGLVKANNRVGVKRRKSDSEEDKAEDGEEVKKEETE